MRSAGGAGYASGLRLGRDDLLFGGIAVLFDLLLVKHEGVPRSLLIWLLVCAVALSPLRYLILQFFMAIAYPVQSFSASISTLPLAVYVPIVLSILFAIGVGLPSIAVLAIIGFEEPISKLRIFLGAIATPIKSSITTTANPFPIISFPHISKEDLIYKSL